MSGSLTKKVVHGATWMGIAQVLGQGFRFLAMIFLARLLAPEDFGLVALASVITSLIVRGVDLGFNQAIVQRKEVTASHLSTTFWTGIGIGVLCYAVIAAISPLVAHFFGDNSVRLVLTVLAISFVIQPVGAVHGALLRRNLDFFRFAIGEMAGGAAYLLVALGLALAGLGVWSLVIGALASDSLYVAMRWVQCPWRPSLQFSRRSLHDLWGFGMNITATKLVGFVAMKLDYFVVGRFLTPVAVGFYNLGRRVVDFPADNLSCMVTRVTFPAFSMIQDEDERLRSGFMKTVIYVSLIGLPLLVGLAITAPELVPVVFGDKWAPSVPLVRILCVAAVGSLLSGLTTSLLWSKGRPDIDLHLTALRLALLMPALLIGVQFGKAGVAWGVTAVTVVLCPLQQVLANRLIGLKMTTYLSGLWPAVAGSAFMAIVLVPLRYQAGGPGGLPDLALTIMLALAGVVTYLAALKVGRVRALDEMVTLIWDLVRPHFLRVRRWMPSWRRGVIRNTVEAEPRSRDDH